MENRDLIPLQPLQRISLHCPKNEDYALRTYLARFTTRADNVLKYRGFELKFANGPIKATVVIFDEKVALAAMQVGEDLLKSPIVCTNNDAFLAIFSEYSASMWSAGISYGTKNNSLPAQ